MAVGQQGKFGSAAEAWLRALERIKPIGDDARLTLPALIEALAPTFDSTPALLTDQECLTYSDIADRINQYANWAVTQDLARGDVVGLLMQNCPEYMMIWLGLSRVGVIVALLNVGLTGTSLAHSIDIVVPRHLIVGSGLVDNLLTAIPHLSGSVRFWVHGQTHHNFPRIDQIVYADINAPRPISADHAPTLADQALYIYTSGTTGLPKAANVSHLRVMQWSHWFAGMMDTRAGDRMYNCLPMYHATGGVVATGAMLVSGGSVLIRPQFSASQFWSDVVEWDCSLFQYIGELCRYLLNSAPHPHETNHTLRLCCGNGLSANIWEKFQQRFRIPRILEFYAATEATFSLYNCEGKPGAIGRIPPFLAYRSQVAVVRFDINTGEPARGDDGFCIRCAEGEAGEALGELAGNDPFSGSRFEGYTDRNASSRKLLRDVFAEGDTWFRTGDLMRKDKSGYFYFVDRIGDTFRWKGENVSTGEVTAVILGFPGVSEAVVYGVTVPEAEGRAGMAAITVEPNFDVAALRSHLSLHLPEYAHPLFLRICENIEKTATFRPKKYDLALEGYEPAAGGEIVYFNDRSVHAFVPLDVPLLEQLRLGLVPL